MPAGASTRSPSISNVARPALDEVELLLQVLLPRLVVLVDDPVACLAARPRVHAEGRDAEVVPDRPPGTAAVADLVDLVKVRHCVTAHRTPVQVGRG
jgi:hypothetical protein